MTSAGFINVTLQEDVPQHVLRTADDFSSSDDDDDDENKSENSEEDKHEEMELDHGEEFEAERNSGWADAMAKVLKMNAPKGKETIVLAKARTLSDVQKKRKPPDVEFEIEGETKEEKPNPELLQKEIEHKRSEKLKKKEWTLKARIKPSTLEKNRERTLAKIGTKGVVQLFNAVKDHQRQMNKKLSEAGSATKKEKVLKSVDKVSFLDMLMGSSGLNNQKRDPKKTEAELELKEEENSSWKVLRDNFMMGGTLKDWDKDLESDSITKGIKKTK